MVLQLRRTGLGYSTFKPQAVAITVEEMRKKLTIDAKHNQDVMVKGRDIHVSDDGLVMLRGKTNDRGFDVAWEGGPYSWRDFAFGQFCAKLEIPGDFVRKSPVTGPASKKAIIDHWKGEVDGKTFLMRLHNLEKPDEKTKSVGLVRAVLSERFSKFDNLELLDVAEPFIKSEGLICQIGANTEKSFHMRLVHPKTIDFTGPGGKLDVHQVGVHVLNSEVGAYNLLGDFFTYRQICTNGLVVLFDKKHLFQCKHIGIEAHEVRTRFAAALQTMHDKTEVFFERLDRSVTTKLPDPLATLHQHLKYSKATDDFIQAATLAYEEEPAASRYGIVQAITRAAQKLPIDQRLEMEGVAGRFLMAA